MIVRFRGERLLNFPREVAEYPIFELLVVQSDTYTLRDETMSWRRRRGTFRAKSLPRGPRPAVRNSSRWPLQPGFHPIEATPLSAESPDAARV